MAEGGSVSNKHPRRHRLVSWLAMLGCCLALGACGGSVSAGHLPSPSEVHRALAGAPKPLAAVYRQGDRLLPGGTGAFERRLRSLRGHPVVVNKWASWCEPCRRELPMFARAAARFGKRVAFLGVDANDSTAAARTFLGELPLPYPSFSDPHQDIAQLMGATAGFPETVFYDRHGNRSYIKAGQYSNGAMLAADIRHYALGG